MSLLQATRKSYTVAFQGELGAYSQRAIYAYFGKNKVKQVLPLPTFKQVFESLFSSLEGGSGKPEYAVVPIENSLAGSVGETLDLLLVSNVKITGEVEIPIRHSLMVHTDSSIADIKRVISHPQAIAQCRDYLNSKHWEQIPVYDTAGAAKMIRDENLKDTAAIACELAAEIYGLKVVEEGIEDDPSNVTRFVVIEPKSNTDEKLGDCDPNEMPKPGVNYKTSLLFVTRHVPGSLVGALSALSSRGINLTKIESRPIKKKPWEYYFYVDFEGHIADGRCKDAIKELKERTVELKILGSYERKT